MSKKLVLIFAAFVVATGAPSSVFAQTDQNVVIVCPNGLPGDGQDTIVLNLTARTVASESRWNAPPSGQLIDSHDTGIITAITDQEVDWTLSPGQNPWKYTLNRFTLDLTYPADSVTGQMIHLSCHKQEKQL
jgi:hypothetical protein